MPLLRALPEGAAIPMPVRSLEGAATSTSARSLTAPGRA